MQRNFRKSLSLLVLAMCLLAIGAPKARADLYLGAYSPQWNVKIHVIGVHNGYAGPAVGYHDHINLHVWIHPHGAWNDQNRYEVSNLHVSIIRGCVYIYDSRTRRSWERCINWNSWSSAYDSIQSAINDAIQDQTGMRFSSGWMYWLVVVCIAPCIFLIMV